MKITVQCLLLFCGVLNVAAAEEKPVRVLVWDEQQPQQKSAYGDLFLGETIAANLSQRAGLSVKTADLGMAEQGLDEETLGATDVLVWWGHVRHAQVSGSVAERVVNRVLEGRLSLIALHSAHFAQPFMRLMQERAKQDIPQMLRELGRAGDVVDVTEPLKRRMVNAETVLTPRLETSEGGFKLIPPACVFPKWRADGAPSHVSTLLPEHPIARGLPAKWDILQTEMYAEPFHVPAPDEVVFEERWDKGEYFRSGCVWRVGKGRVFYFRPGHETYPVFKQAEPMLVLENAVRWLAKP